MIVQQCEVCAFQQMDRQELTCVRCAYRAQEAEVARLRALIETALKIAVDDQFGAPHEMAGALPAIVSTLDAALRSTSDPSKP